MQWNLNRKKGTLLKVHDRIKDLFPEVNDWTRRELISIVNTIKASIGDEKHWDNFKIYFENISPSFLKRLNKKHPDLTSKDIKYCCYLKMNMSNNEIGHLMGINQESVRTHKYRLKKKMALPKFQDLQVYVKSIA